MTPGSRNAWANALLVCGSFAVSAVVAEIGVRIVDPLPYFSPTEINETEHGNLSEYDPDLGWRGVPRGAAQMVTRNQRVWLQNNSLGFRDIEHDPQSRKPAIVFLGDSFTWGFEVEFDQMFVNLVRRRLAEYEVFNLAHTGYGTDQSLLTFRRWRYDGPLQTVVLMFYENDVADNNSIVRYGKPKPRFELVDGQMQLRGVPVPRTPAWRTDEPRIAEDRSWRGRVKWLLLRSHLLSHFYQLIWRPWREEGWRPWREEGPTSAASAPAQTADPAANPDGPYATTQWLLGELNKEARERGGTLLVGFIPPRIEVEHLRSDRVPNHVPVGAICRDLGIATIEFAPALEASWLRVYYHGAHWNARGHRIAADVLYDRLRSLPSAQ
jgi:hypothetical protein